MTLRERLSGVPLSKKEDVAPKIKTLKSSPPSVHQEVIRNNILLETQWWVFRIPARLWFILQVATSPFRALIWILDGLVALSVLSVIGIVWAWWTQHITDDQVAGVIGEIGARGLSILAKAKIL